MPEPLLPTPLIPASHGSGLTLAATQAKTTSVRTGKQFYGQDSRQLPVSIGKWVFSLAMFQVRQVLSLVLATCRWGYTLQSRCWCGTNSGKAAGLSGEIFFMEILKVIRLAWGVQPRMTVWYKRNLSWKIISDKPKAFPLVTGQTSGFKNRRTLVARS